MFTPVYHGFAMLGSHWPPYLVLKHPPQRLKFLDGQGDNGCPCEFSWKITVELPEFDEQELPGSQQIYIYIYISLSIYLSIYIYISG